MQWKGVVVHCSDSDFGDADLIDRWHKERGWDGIGYNFVITRDGELQLGRSLNRAGAHANGYNKTHIGICLIGVNMFTDEQFTTLTTLLTSLSAAFGIHAANILGHYQCTGTQKTCPNFDVPTFVQINVPFKPILE